MKINIILLAALVLTTCTHSKDHATVSTYAGNGRMGMSNGSALEASFANPMGICSDEKGNLYIADSHNNVVRKIDPNGNVNTLAGSDSAGDLDGNGSRASFFYPVAVCVDHNGNVYVSDTHNNLIRKIDPQGMVTTVAGLRSGYENKMKQSLGTKLDNPAGICIDLQGNLFIADWANNVIREVGPDGSAKILAGTMGNRGAKDGKGPEATFYLPWGIVLDSLSNVYVSDFRNNMIRKISPAGMVLTIAGRTTRGSTDGLGKAASFFHPAGIAIDKKGNLYVADSGNNKIRKITPEGMVTTIAGDGSRGKSNGQALDASFYKPYALAFGPDGSLFVADYQNNLIRKISF